MSRTPPALRRFVFASLLLALPLGACGGSSGGGGGGGGGGGTPPTALISAPTSGVIALRGDLVPVTFTANDDGAAQVRLVADVDGNFGTTGDQTTVFGPVLDANGASTQVNALTQPLAPGAYTLFLVVDDGFNPVATATMGGSFVVFAGRAGVSPTRSTAYGVQNDRIVLTVGESENGPPASLNGDLDTADGVLGTLDTLTGAFTQHATSIDVTGVDLQGTARRIEFLGPYAFHSTREADQSAFINGDPDQTDVMTSFYESTTPAVTTHVYGGLTPTGLLGAKSIGRLVEAQEGVGGTIRNGDGDTIDTVIALLDASTNTLTTIPYAVVPNSVVHRDGARFAYLASEAGQGADLNADGDATDALVVLADVLAPVPFLGFAGFGPPQQGRGVQPGAAFAVSSTGRLGYYVDEATTGLDVNGDADQVDHVPAIWFKPGVPPPGVETLPGLAAATLLESGNNTRHAFFLFNTFVYTAIELLAYSPPQGDNGDNDVADQEILRWTSTGTPTLTAVLNPNLGVPFTTLTGLALDGGSLAQVAPGWLAAVVQESANGGLDLSGDGAIGSALLLIDCTGAAPVVHNTGLTTAANGRIPVTGIGSTTGVVVSAPESVNGILNGDADASDTLALFIPFASPGTPIQLASTGAVDALVVNARIGLTASETLTGVDHNLDGDTLDFVFRIVSTSAIVELGGLTCAPTSRPAAAVGGSLWAFLRSEAAEVRDLNGDGDQFDVVVGAWKP